jgi:predicted nucleic acid-binding protein
MGTENVDRPAVADAGPLIHLHEVDALDQLGLFETLLVPKVVWQEATTAGRVPAAALRRLESVRQVDDPPAEQAVSFDLLDAGERACLRLCRHERIGLFLTDDLEAREAAQKEGIRPVGSLGIVLRANREGRLTKQTARRTLEALRDQSTLFVRPALVNRVIAKLKNG